MVKLNKKLYIMYNSLFKVCIKIWQLCLAESKQNNRQHITSCNYALTGVYL